MNSGEEPREIPDEGRWENADEEDEVLDFPASWELLEAAQSGDEARVESLLAEVELNVNVKESNSSAFTALHHAARANYEKVLKLLLCCPEIDVDARDGFNRTPLMLASDLGHIQAVELLLRNRADLLVCDRGGFNCLHLAAIKGHFDVVTLLIEEDDYDRFWEDPEEDDAVQFSPLMPRVAARTRSWKSFTSTHIRLQLMEQKSADASFTALHMAAKGGHVSIAVQLLRGYLTLSLKDNGFVHYPRDHDLMRKFLEHVKSVVSTRNHTKSENEAHLDTVIRYQLEGYWQSLKGYNWKIQFSEMLCIQRNEVREFVGRLVDAFGKVISYSNATDNSKRTCLHIIALKCQMQKSARDAAKCVNCFLKQLLELGTLDVNVPDIDGNTPLHLASVVENICLVRHSLDTGLIPNLGAENCDGLMPLRTALIHMQPLYKAPGTVLSTSDRNLLCGGFGGNRGIRVPPKSARWGWRLDICSVSDMLEREVTLRFGALEGSDRGLLRASSELLWSLKELLERRQIKHEEDHRLRKGLESEGHYGGLTMLHYAAFRGFSKELQALLKLPKCQSLVNMLSHGTGQSPLHLAVIEGQKDVVKVLMDRREVLLLRTTEEDAFDRTPIELARKSKTFYESHAAIDNWKEKSYDLRDIEMMLLADLDVQESLRKLNSERQDYVDATNAILVGAALIASVTYAGWLQPPLGLQQLRAQNQNETAVSVLEFAAVASQGVRVFLVFNSLSFFFAIATVVSGAAAVLKTSGDFIADEVREIQNWLVRTSLLLVLSISCVLGAFAAAGSAVLPPIRKYQKIMFFTVFVGGLVCFLILVSFFRRFVKMLPRRIRKKLEGWMALNKLHNSPQPDAGKQSPSSFDHGLYEASDWSFFGT